MRREVGDDRGRAPADAGAGRRTGGGLPRHRVPGRQRSHTGAPEIRDAVLRAIGNWATCPTPRRAAWSPSAPTRWPWSSPSRPTRVFSDDPLFPGIVRGVSQELEEADQQLVLMLATSAASHERMEQYALARHVDGVMLASMHGADPLPLALHRMHIPVVSMERPLGRSTSRSSDVDTSPGPRRRSGTWSSGADPDRHHRRPAGHAGRHRPADRLPEHAARLDSGAPSSPWATSPGSPARLPCANCSATTPAWTPSSWRPT